MPTSNYSDPLSLHLRLPAGTDKPATYLDLLSRLDNKTYAREFFALQLTETRYLITSLLMKTSGAMELDDEAENEGHYEMVELFEIFSIHHRHFDAAGLARELQREVLSLIDERRKQHEAWSQEAVDSEIDASPGAVVMPAAQPAALAA